MQMRFFTSSRLLPAGFMLFAFVLTSWAQNTGTADGTYNFGSIGTAGSGGSGFKTQGDKFKVSNIFENDGTVMYANNSSYAIRPRTTDQGGLFYEKTFTIPINDLNESIPSVSISSTAGSGTAVSPIPITITFSEAVTLFVIGDIAVSGGTKSNFSGSGANYSVDITPSGNGTVTVNIAANAAQSASAVGNTAATQFSIAYNTACGTLMAAPVLLSGPVSLNPALNSFAANETAGWTQIQAHNTGGAGNMWSPVQTIPFNFTFMGQAVTQYCLSKNYLLTFTTSVAGTAVNALLADNTALPNANLPANTIAFFWDKFTVPPAGTQDDAIFYKVYGAAPNRQLWVKFHSYITEGLDHSYGMVVLEETTNKIYIIDIRNFAAGQGSRTVGIQRDVNRFIQSPGSPNIQSINGNVSGNAFPSAKYWIFTPPSEETEVSATYNTAPSAFSSVLSLIGGTGSVSYLWQQSDDDNAWAPASGTNNQSTYQAPTLTETTYYRRKITDNTCGDVVYDSKYKVAVSLPPATVTITTTETSPTKNSPIPVKIDFNEDVSGFETGDVTVSGATKSNFAGSGKNYTVDITPTADGTITVDVTAGVVYIPDPSGTRTNTAATQFSIAYDGTGPQPTITATGANPTNNSAITVKIDFNENVTGFDIGDITVSGGTRGNFSGSGKNYTVDVTASAPGVITVDVAASVAQDAVGNENTAATQLSITYDITAPGVVISSTASDPTTTNPVPVKIDFSEAVTGFDISDIVVAGATKGNFAGSGKNYTVDLTPTLQGNITVDVAANLAQDAAGNGNTVATQFSIAYDNTAPGVVISSTVSGPSAASPIPVKIDFDESVTGFDLSDIVVSGGTKGNFSGSGENYTFDLTPTSQGTLTVDLAASAAQDAAGNGNTVATQFSIIHDSSRPSIVISSTVTGPTNSTSIPVKVDFSENVTGFDVNDIVVSGATKSNFNGSGKNYTFDLAASVSGVLTVDIAANAAQDAASNQNTAATQFTIEFDNTQPTVAISSVVSGPTSLNPIPVKIDFSEDVTGFGIGDVAVAGGTRSNFTGTGKNYTVDVTPAAEGIITVTVAAGAAADQAGNTTTAPSAFTIQYTTCVPPSVTSISADRMICSGAGASFTATASGDGLTYQWQVDHGSGFSDISNGGVYQGSNTITLTVSGAAYSLNGAAYRVIVSGTCNPPATSEVRHLTVLPPVEGGEVGSDQTIFYGEAASGLSSIQAASGANGQFTYQWEQSADGDTFTSISAATGTTYAPGILYATTVFRRIATASDACGMAASNAITVTVEHHALDKGLIPNALFPNGTSRNQTWGISHLGHREPVEIRVFDNDGRQLFRTSDAQQEWDGKHNGKLAPEGTYFYTIENKAGKMIQGSIQIVY